MAECDEVTTDDIENVISQLKIGKHDGDQGLESDHLIYAQYYYIGFEVVLLVLVLDIHKWLSVSLFLLLCQYQKMEGGQ